MGLALVLFITTGKGKKNCQIQEFCKAKKATYVGDGQASCGLPAADLSETSLVFHNAVGDAHLPTEGGQEQNQL